MRLKMSLFNLLWLFVGISSIQVQAQVPNTWTQRASLPSDSGYGGFAVFVIGSKAYICGGSRIDYNDFQTRYSNELWEYDILADSWTRKADYPGGKRGLPFGFAINGKGYVGGGTPHYFPADTSIFPYREMYEYDPVANTWTQKASYPGQGLQEHVGFAIDGFAYVGLGYKWPLPFNDPSLLNQTSYAFDFWRYNPQTDSWAQLDSFPGTARKSATCMVAGNLGYVASGFQFPENTSAPYNMTFWEFNPTTTHWTEKTAIPGFDRYGMGGVGAYGKPFIVSGSDNNGLGTPEFKVYNTVTGVWQALAPFPSAPGDRQFPYCFSYNNRIFVGGGLDFDADIPLEMPGNYGNWVGYKDLWEYSANPVLGVDQEVSGSNDHFIVYPNPASNLVQISTGNELSGEQFMQIWDVSGRCVGSAILNQGSGQYNVSLLANGTYHYKISDKNETQVYQTGKIIVLR
jgi:N-acetylneuraminic acid mutarotase